jgi:hypothetical protein
MRGKFWFMGGVAVGFVLGSRAGRERYEELARNARKLWEHPTVQEAAGAAQAQATRIYTEGKGKLNNTKIGERLGMGGVGRTEPQDVLAGARSRPPMGPGPEAQEPPGGAGNMF